MKPEERAEKIVEHIESIYGKRTGWVIDFVAEQIAEAEREAVENYTKLPVNTRDFNRGFAAAKAKAAEVVREKYFQAASEDSCAEEWLAAQIEALEP